MLEGPHRTTLVALLAALAVLYLAWFAGDRHFLAALLVFVLPIALLLAAVTAGSARAAFWAGVLGLFWFSHGVMIAWSHPAQAGWAWAEIVLSLVIIVAGSWPGLRARFGGRQ